ncbi:MAG TPA: SH3 domain-containing protein [Anaerolineales bacterium]|nr:SH3 domain-containing protein [Anaerolineales bacterium]
MFKTQNLYQNDEKWKNVRLGNSSETLGGWGCLLTSATMVLNGIGYNETPETVNEKMKRAGGFQGAFFIPSVLPYIWPNCAYRDMQSCESYPAPIAQIDQAIAAGKPVILQVDWNQQAGVQTHFVLVKEKQGDDYVIYDPYKYSGDGPGKDVLLTKRYKFNGARLETEISAVLWLDSYGVPAEPPKMTKAPVPAENYTLYTMEDDLALRAQPSTGGFLVKRLMMGTELISLEPKSTAKGKLGVNGKWIQIQDSNGDQGYVAAWYVSDVKGMPATSASTSTASTGIGNLPPGALLLVPTAQLSLRTAPRVAPETLMRYIPVTEQLISLEPAQQAIPKVGVEGQWLKVRDASGKEGYVAAWFVRYISGSTAQETADSPTVMSSNGGPMKVRAAAEGVALRRQPVVSDSTLIKRLSLGTELTVLEPNGEAKIGRNDQWLKVKDPVGAEGVVAAWFVAR